MSVAWKGEPSGCSTPRQPSGAWSKPKLQTQNAASVMRHRVVPSDHKEGMLVLGRSGNDLLSRVLRHSTIGAEEFNGRVRDGIGFGLLAQITGPAKDKILLASGAGGPVRALGCPRMSAGAQSRLRPSAGCDCV